LETEDLIAVLKELNQSNDQILLSMVVSNDGLTLAHEGNTQDPDKFSASYIELELVADKVMSELEYGKLEELFIRSAAGCVSIMPIFNKGVLAVMATPDVTPGKLQIVTWKAINQLNNIMPD
jgi:predicted regulator of Ras-like GTPase activity (Roadblock/LC7/MglB family)